MENKSHHMYFEFEQMIDIINEYNLVNEVKESKLSSFLTFSEENEYFIFKQDNGEKTSYNIFYDNIHIRLEISPKEKVYSVHLKKVEDNWSFITVEGSEMCDYSHPSNQTFRVFVSYDVPVLNITRAVGDNYTSGAWDSYLYNKLNDFKTIISNCTDCAKFNKDYNNM